MFFSHWIVQKPLTEHWLWLSRELESKSLGKELRGWEWGVEEPLDWG